MVAASVVITGAALAAVKFVADRTATRASAARKRRFRLELSETPKQGIPRVARGELDLTIGLLEAAPNGNGAAEAVHEARKSLKRLRALLRVSRPALDEHHYQLEKVVFRDAGRELSEARDTQVLLQTLDALISRYGDDLPVGTWSRLRDDLATGAQRAQASIGSYNGVLDVLSNARMRVSNWQLPPEDGRVSLSDGFERIYRRGRHALRRARSEQTAENLHEMRKRSKDLWHAAQLLEPVCPDKMKPLAKEAHRLSDLLGDDHDLSVLLDYARQRPTIIDPTELEMLRAAILLRGQSLRRQALECAAGLYRRKPRQMLHRLALA
jgi:CHAD domain-containing protein